MSNERPGISLNIGVPIYGGDPLRSPPQTMSQSVNPSIFVRKSEDSKLARPSLSTFTSAGRSPGSQASALKTHFLSSNLGVQQQSPKKINPEALNTARKNLIEELPETIDGLKQIMKIHAWKEATRLAKQLQYNTDNLQLKLQLKLDIIICLMKSREYQQAHEEIEELGNLDDPIYFSKQKGYIIPFSLKLLKAELPSYLSPDKIFLSIDLLYHLLHQIQSKLSKIQSPKNPQIPELNVKDLDSLISDPLLQGDGTTLTRQLSEDLLSNDPDSYQLWKSREIRVYFSIVTRLIQRQDYIPALQIMSQLAQLYPSDAVLLSGEARIHLQMGNVEIATKICVQIERLVEDVEKSVIVHMNRGYLAFALNKFDAAIRHFEYVIQLEPTNLAAINNRALVWLYKCDLGKAISSLEEAVKNDPPKSLSDALIFNLCTLYDLASDQSTDRKEDLMEFVMTHSGPDDFDVLNFKLNLKEQ